MIDAKIALSSQPSVKLDIELPGGKRYRREITREQFEQLIATDHRSHRGPVQAGSEGCRLSSQSRSTKSCWSAARRASRRFAQLVKEMFQRDAAHRSESGRSCRARSRRAGQHPGRRLRSHARHAAARRHASFARHRSRWRSDRQDHSAQLDDSCVGHPASTRRRSTDKPTSPSTCCKASANWRKTAARWRASI